MKLKPYHKIKSHGSCYSFIWLIDTCIDIYFHLTNKYFKLPFSCQRQTMWASGLDQFILDWFLNITSEGTTSCYYFLGLFPYKNGKWQGTNSSQGYDLAMAGSSPACFPLTTSNYQLLTIAWGGSIRLCFWKAFPEQVRKNSSPVGPPNTS